MFLFVQASGAVRLAVMEMMKLAPARSRAQVFKHASCFALSCTLWMSLQFAVWGVSGWCERGAPLAFCEDL